MISEDLVSSVRALRPAVPAKDYAESQRFYEAIRFEARALGPTLTEMSVENVDAWWAHIEALGLEKTFKVRAPIAPRLEPWGLRVTYLIRAASCGR